MPSLNVNGQRYVFKPGSSILAACQSVGIQIPTLCHDPRLNPIGACRVCVVEVDGWENYATACNTEVADGMTIQTHSESIEVTRRTLLEMLAHDYPADVSELTPEKPFHQLLRQYRVATHSSESRPGCGTAKAEAEASTGRGDTSFRDTTHPYLRADLSQCITCYRCVRVCNELQGQFVWRTWNRGDRTSIRPGDAPTLMTSGCVSCGACVDTCPTGALEDQSVWKEGVPTEWTRTICPYCGVGCEMDVGARAGRIVQIKPALNAPVSRGHLCVKGRYAFDFVRAEDRVTEPMIRDGEQWRTVSWESAIQYVAERLQEVLKTSGADRIGMLGSARATNEENYLTQKFARLVLGTNNVDCCARVCHAPTAAGMRQIFGTGAATNSFEDIEKANAFLVAGCNPTENHPIVGARIKQAVLRGAKLVVIDPRRIELAGYADVHLQLRAGTNIPLFHSLAHVVVFECLVDQVALRERIDGFEEFREFIAKWPPERAAQITGVAAEQIREAARIYATTKPAMCFHGLGITEHVQGTEGVMCLVNLALLTANFGKPGAGINPLRGQNNVQGSAHMGCEPANLTGFVPIDQGRESFEAVWGAAIPKTKGQNLIQMMELASEGGLDALWAIGYDVALTNPNTQFTRKALGKLKFVIAQDLFLTELASSFAHVFLPACSSFEKDGTFMNSERRIQRVRRALPPAGNSRSDWQIVCAVARAMGFAKGFAYESSEEIWNEVRTVWKAGAGISYERLEEGGLQWPCPTLDHPGTAVLHTESFTHGRRAPLKRIDFHPTVERCDERFPFLLTTGRSLYQFNAGTMTMRTPNKVLREEDTLDMAPADARRLGLADGDRVRIRSRHGETVLRLRVENKLREGELFATFQTVAAGLNKLTSPYRDNTVMTPEYKVVAVNVQKEPLYACE